MKAGQFNINEYLEKLYESVADGALPDKEGMVIPDENQKAYQWLKKEYQKAQTEVKVEMRLGDSKFEPGYDLQTDLKSVKDFKPGMFGEVKTAENKKPDKAGGPNNFGDKTSLDKTSLKDKSTPETGEKKPMPKETEDKEHEEKEGKGHEEAESKEHEEKERTGQVKDKADKSEKEEKSEVKKEEPEIKKIDLKTKKK